MADSNGFHIAANCKNFLTFTIWSPYGLHLAIMKFLCRLGMKIINCILFIIYVSFDDDFPFFVSRDELCIKFFSFFKFKPKIFKNNKIPIIHNILLKKSVNSLTWSLSVSICKAWSNDINSFTVVWKVGKAIPK